MTRAILLDLFDTLVDLRLDGLPSVEIDGRPVRSTLPLLHAAMGDPAPITLPALAQALRAVDREVGRPRVEAGREFPTRERFAALCRSLEIEDPALPERLRAVHMGAIRERVGAVAHHAEVLRSLRERYHLALCSNFSDADTAHDVLRDVGLADLLHVTVISEAVDARKPGPAIFEACLAPLGAAPEEAVHVGDSLRADVAGAEAAGIPSVWITRRVTDADAALASHSGPPPSARIADLRELPALLEAGLRAG